jgi:hypothetical protein
MRYDFVCQHSSNDVLTLELESDGDLRIAVKDGTDDVTVAFYVRPEDMGPFARAVASLSANRRRMLNPPVVPTYMTQGMPVPPQDYRTPEQVEADEQASKAERRQGRPVTFAEAMLPQPGTEGRERAFLRATELLGATASGESRVELARFLAGEGRAWL